MQTALMSFVRSLAMEYGRRRISCNAVIMTELESIEPAGETILFLASSKASFVSPDVFHVR
jgi:hypothetical protein